MFKKLAKEVFVYNKSNKHIFTCSSKQARHYLRKGYARFEDNNKIIMLDNSTENRLISLYGSLDNPFLLSKKNHQCVVCGIKQDLTKHHVIPKRHIKKIKKSIRQSLSNTICICRHCHNKYEDLSSHEPIDFNGYSLEYVYQWKDHFINSMNPKFLPIGWDIFFPKNDES